MIDRKPIQPSPVNAEPKREDLIKKNLELIRNLRERGAQELFDNAKGLEEALQPKEHLCIGCMDEGVSGKDFGMAGSGVFLGVEKTAKYLKENGIDRINSHMHCAAAAAAFKQDNADISLNDPDFSRRVEEYAQEFAMKVAEKANIEYVGHIDPTEIRPADLHISGIVYYSSRHIDLSQTDLPPGFTVSKLAENPKGALEDVDLATQIALGSHGLGRDNLHGDTPAMLIAIARSKKEAESMQGELSVVQEKYGKEFVAIDTVVLQ